LIYWVMSDKMKIIWGIVAAIILIGGVWYFGGGKTATTEEPIKIGVLLPLSGSAAYYGEMSKKGIEIAKDELTNKYPKLNLEVFYEDSLYTAQGGVIAYNKLLSVNRVDAVITGASQVSLAVLPLATKDNILQMAIFSTAAKYTTPDDLSFRVSARSEIEAKEIAKLIKNKNFHKLGIIYLNNDFGISFKDALKNAFEKNEATIQIIGEEGYMLDTADFRTIITKLKQTDAIFMVGTAKQYNLIIKQARELGFSGQFLSMYSAENSELLAGIGNTADGLLYTYHFNKNATDEARNFNDVFMRKYGDIPNAYAAEGYEGMKLTVSALKDCHNDKQCIMSYFKTLKDYKSVFGDMSFDQNGDVFYKFFIKTIKNGQFVPYEE